MSDGSTLRKRNGSVIAREYRSALRRYMAHQGETGLRRAYELGRQAIDEGRGIMEVASLHQQAILQFLAHPGEKGHRQRSLQASTEFLLETLSPYEMAYRGFHDAIQALRRVNETLEEETRRIAVAVHDEAGQSLVAVHLALAELSEELPGDQRHRIRQIEELLQQAEAHLRRLSHELRPAVLDDLGWVAAIRFLADGVSKRTGVLVQIKAAFTGRLSGTVETALYRVVQEALTNATKHARARTVTIQIRRRSQAVCCSVQDDGTGFDISAVGTDHNRGLGLAAMKERLNAVGGTFSIQSARGSGTKISIQVPLD